MKNTPTQNTRGFFNLGRHWPFVIALMLLAHASIMIGTIIHVGAKRDTYVDPAYYAKSVDWDTQRAMKEAADNAGWTVRISSEFVEQSPDQRRVQIELRDADGQPIEDALVELICYHPAQISNRFDEVVLHDQNGVYAKGLPIARPGIWYAELTIQRRGVRALVTKDLDVFSVPLDSMPREN